MQRRKKKNLVKYLCKASQFQVYSFWYFSFFLFAGESKSGKLKRHADNWLGSGQYGVSVSFEPSILL